MHDSTAKLTSGLLNGNINQYGDFDQCLNVISSDKDIQGNYCLAQIKPTIPKNTPYLKHLKKLLLSNEAFKSDFNDVRLIFHNVSNITITSYDIISRYHLSCQYLRPSSGDFAYHHPVLTKTLSLHYKIPLPTSSIKPKLISKLKLRKRCANRSP